MLHELFLALSGYGNSLVDNIEELEITENRDGSTATATATTTTTTTSSSDSIVGNIIGSSSMFHPCELKIITEILHVAGYYKKIVHFYEKVVSNSVVVPDSSRSQNKSVQSGHYLTSLATALYEETKMYQKKVVLLERNYLENPNLLLSTILLSVTPFYSIFVELSHLIDVVEKEKLRGCRILDHLHKEVISAVGEIQTVFKRIKCCLQKVLIEQLVYWLLYGELVDPHKELFLSVARGLPQVDKGVDRGSSLEVNTTQTESVSPSLEVCLHAEMLPDFIPPSAAEKILFIGESILCFEREGTREKGDLSSRSGLILRKKEKELLHRFESLSQQQSFSLTQFVDLVETVRLCVAEHVHSLVVGAGLTAELHHMKDIFLLGRGELYHAFFILSQDKRPNVTNVNTLFRKAGRQVMMEENVLDKFIVTYEEPDSVSEAGGNDWKHVRVSYQAEWPLHKFFGPRVQRKYNAILRFLLDMRQSQLKLQSVWLSHKEHKDSGGGSFYLLFWTLRHHMSLLIYNIQYYIQVDVLESRFSELTEKMSVLQDYQRLSFEHESFLSSITTQCFLSHPLISSSISSILGKVNSFCHLFADHRTPSTAEIECVKEDFDRASTKFFWALTTLGQSRNSQFTSQLIMRIDYNKFYTRKTANLRFLEQA